jgi:Lon protease-like protein
MNADDLTPKALAEVPIFPLPGTVLLPRTMISLHVFEPRYRAMTEDCLEGHRLMAIAMLDPASEPDAEDRPAIHRVAGLGALRRSARLPDGRFNLVVEGLCRVRLGPELPMDKAYRRAPAEVLHDVAPEEPAALASAMASLRALCARAMAQLSPKDASELEGLNQVTDPGHLADLVAAAAMPDAEERQQVLDEVDVEKRVQLVAGALGAYLLSHAPESETGAFGWGIHPGKA